MKAFEKNYIEIAYLEMAWLEKDRWCFSISVNASSDSQYLWSFWALTVFFVRRKSKIDFVKRWSLNEEEKLFLEITVLFRVPFFKSIVEEKLMSLWYFMFVAMVASALRWWKKKLK